MGGGTLITHIAALGEGAGEDGMFYPDTAPGDRICPDGTVQRGPHHQVPPCSHFGACGGCQLQHIDEDTWTKFITDRVVQNVLRRNISPHEVFPAHLSPLHSRRRVTLHSTLGKNGVLGFRRQGSHQIINLQSCAVMQPALFALVAPLRALMRSFSGGNAADIYLAQADQGVVCEISKLPLQGYDTIQNILDFAQHHRLARLSVDQGYGHEVQWEPEPVTISLGGYPVPLPFNAFLQPTGDGEEAMIKDACEWLSDSEVIADLFSGLGTFALALMREGRKIYAAEAARDPHLACQSVARTNRLGIEAAHRDLFRNPLTPSELGQFDAVLLDPPRAGAKEQVQQIAKSALTRVFYASCNPNSWARDAEVLADAGFKLVKLRPIGQFRWSTHVELTSLFVR